MKKKLLSIILAIAMSVGAFGALVGCDEENILPTKAKTKNKTKATVVGTTKDPKSLKTKASGASKSPKKVF